MAAAAATTAAAAAAATPSPAPPPLPPAAAATTAAMYYYVAYVLLCTITICVVFPPFTSLIISLSLPYSKPDSNPPLTCGLLQEVSLARSDSHIASIGSPRQKKDRGEEDFARSCCLLIVIKIESSNTTTHPLRPPHEHDADDEAGSDVNRGGAAPLEPEDVLFQSVCSSGTGIQSSKLRVGG